MVRRTPIAIAVVVAACGSSSRPPADPAPPHVLAVQTAVESAILPAVVVRGEETHSTLAERMAALHVNAVSIAVFDDYHLVWAKAYGTADAETGTKVSESTLFQAGSISKSVNALAVLTAVTDGTFALDTPINTYLTSWKLPDNELTAKTPVTLRRILSHTAGTTVHGFPGYQDGTPVPTLVQVLDGAPPANTPAIRVDLAPGTQFRYSGGGITISQLAMVEQLGQPYPEILRARVLDPIGMTDSTYEQPLPAGRVGAAAAGYYADGSPVPGKRHVYPEMAAAGLWTTPTDLAKFFIEIELARAGKSSVITKDVAMLMTTEEAHDAHAGLGVFMTDRNGTMMFGHNGADEGFQADAIAALDGGFGVVIMANSDNGIQLFQELEPTVFAAMHWPCADAPIDRVALTAAERDAVIGRYVDDQGGLWAVTAHGADRVDFGFPLFAPVDLIAVGAGKFVNSDDGVALAFASDGTVALSKGPARWTAKRVADAALPPLFELAEGRDQQAATALQHLLSAQPASPVASESFYNNYGYQLLQRGQLDGAVRVFRMVTVAVPTSSNAFDSLGEALMANGKTADAIAAYRQAVALLDADPAIPAGEKPARKQHALDQLAKLGAK